MALIIDGTEIPENGTVIIDGVETDVVEVNGTVVWRKYEYVGPPSPVIITASRDYTAGIDFPADKELTINVLGAGGAGGWGDVFHYGNGGYAASVSSGNRTYPNGTVISAVVGPGNSSNSDFDGISSTGGSTGSSPVGSNIPGQPGENSAWGTGGAGGTTFSPDGLPGGIGAGGGGAASSAYGTVDGGNGGRGEIRISWS